MDCIWVNLKKVDLPFFQIYGMSVNTCIKMYSDHNTATVLASLCYLFVSHAM